MAGMDSGSSAITPYGNGHSNGVWSEVGDEAGIGGASVQAPQKAPVQEVTRSVTGSNLDPIQGN